MLRGYMDESGGRDTDIIVLAGYIAEVRTWTRFERDWKKVLLEFRVPHFHMKELEHGKGAFKGWGRTKRKDFQNRLLFIIQTIGVIPVSCSVDVADYKEALSEKIPRTFRDPYFHCFTEWLVNAMQYCINHGKDADELALVVDRKEKLAMKITALFNSFKDSDIMFTKQQRAFLKGVVLGDDEDIIPLQAADFLAYEVRESRQGNQRIATAKLNERAGAHIHWDRTRLTQLADHWDSRDP